MFGLVLTTFTVGMLGSVIGTTFAAVTDETDDTESMVRVNREYLEHGMWMGFLVGALVGGGGYYFFTKPAKCELKECKADCENDAECIAECEEEYDSCSEIESCSQSSEERPVRRFRKLRR